MKKTTALSKLFVLLRCNNNTPDLPDNLPDEPTEKPPGPSKTCYNCGYKCSDMVKSTFIVPFEKHINGFEQSNDISAK